MGTCSHRENTGVFTPSLLRWHLEPSSWPGGAVLLGKRPVAFRAVWWALRAVLPLWVRNCSGHPAGAATAQPAPPMPLGLPLTWSLTGTHCVPGTVGGQVGVEARASRRLFGVSRPALSLPSHPGLSLHPSWSGCSWVSWGSPAPIHRGCFTSLSWGCCGFFLA